MVVQIPDENKLEDDSAHELICSSSSSSVQPIPQTDHNPFFILISLYPQKQLQREEYEKKTQMQFWSNIEETLSQSDFECAFEECPPNPFTWAKTTDRDITGNMSSHLDNNEPHSSNRNVSRDPEFEFQHDYTYIHNQHNRKDITRPFSSFVVSTVLFLSIVYNIWNSQLSIINVPPLHKEHDGRSSIWPSLLELFGFMVFVCAATVMILVGAAFTNMQKAMLILWLMLLHLQSSNSISEVFLTLAGGLFMAWYAFGKRQPHNEVI